MTPALVDLLPVINLDIVPHAFAVSSGPDADCVAVGCDSSDKDELGLDECKVCAVTAAMATGRASNDLMMTMRNVIFRRDVVELDVE